MKVLLLATIRAYQRLLSPFFLPACRYVPSCSEYAVEAVETRGAFRGGCKAVCRVLRCHPLARGGYDPVSNEIAVDSRRQGNEYATR